MSTIALHSTSNISETVKNKGLVPKDHQKEMAYWNQMFTLPMTSRDRERSNAWPQYA